MSQSIFFVSLPCDLLISIFSFLDAKQVCGLFYVNKRISLLITGYNYIWKPLLRSRFENMRILRHSLQSTTQSQFQLFVLLAISSCSVCTHGLGAFSVKRRGKERHVLPYECNYCGNDCCANCSCPCSCMDCSLLGVTDELIRVSRMLHCDLCHGVSHSHHHSINRCSQCDLKSCRSCKTLIRCDGYGNYGRCGFFCSDCKALVDCELCGASFCAADGCTRVATCDMCDYTICSRCSTIKSCDDCGGSFCSDCVFVDACAGCDNHTGICEHCGVKQRCSHCSKVECVTCDIEFQWCEQECNDADSAICVMCNDRLRKVIRCSSCDKVGCSQCQSILRCVSCDTQSCSSCDLELMVSICTLCDEHICGHCMESQHTLPGLCAPCTELEERYRDPNVPEGSSLYTEPYLE